MTQICIKCGKKISVFSGDPLNLYEDQTLCYDCSTPIKGDILQLYYAKNSQEFDLLKAKIIEECKKIYEQKIINAVEKKIEQVYINNDYIKELTTNEQQTAKKKFIETYMLTTGYEFSGYKITKYIGVISGQVVLGTGFLSEFTASFADFFGEESNKFADKLETAKNAAVEKLIIKSADKGGNAIIGVDFDYITFHSNMIGVVANGTSVVIEKIEE